MNRVGTGDWTAETCSYILSICTLVGLVATLLAHQNKPLPQWPQLVTVNSIISLFSLLMRTFVGIVLAEGVSQCKWNWFRKARKLNQLERFDSASRGSWGSIVLLYHFRPEQAYCLAALGAIITVMASLTSFFSQQLVQFEDCLQIDKVAVVSILRTNNYTGAGASVMNLVPTDCAPMVAAINVGIIQPVDDLTNILSRGCSSGNCTFPSNEGASFSTVGVSYICEDITTRIRILNETAPTGGTPWISAYLALDYGTNKTMEFQRESGGMVLKTWTNPGPEVLTTVYIISRASSDTTDYTAFSCSLHPSVNTYATIIKNSVLEEKLVKVVPLRSLNAQFPKPPVIDINHDKELFRWSHKMTTNYTLRDGVWKSCNGSETPVPGLIKFMKRSDEPAFVNSTGHTSVSAGWRWWYYPKYCIWTFHGSSAIGIRFTFDEILHNKSISMDGSGQLRGPFHLRKLFQDGILTLDSVNQVMDSITRSMTAVIRTHGDEESSESLRGDVWVNTTCVYIRWPWITFQIVMIWLTGVFLALVMLESRGVERNRLWKSSFLAAIFCEVDIHKKPVGKKEMAAVAASTSVSLEQGTSSGTLRLVTR